MQSNHRYHALFDLAPVAIYEVDFSETKKYFEILRNQGIRNFQEYFTQNIDELLKCHRLAVNLGSNKTLLDIWEAENVEQINRAIYSAFTQKTASYVSHADTMVKLANGFTSFSKDETLFTIRGNIRYIRTHVNVAPGFEKTLARVYICFYDTTELVKMSRELIRYKENLEELVKERTRKLALETEKSLRLNRKVTELYEREMQLREQLESRMKERAELTRFLVHELKTPLTPMLGSTDILLEQVRGTKLERLATNIHRGTISLNNRVNDLLDLARGEMGLLQLNCKYIDISSLVKDTIMFMAIEFERRNQSIVFNPPAEFPQVWADSERIRQVLLNLLENASKFTLPRSTVTVKLEKDDKKVVVQVEDNGFGIKKDRQQAIFSDYSRHAKPDDPAANMGIGLPLCKMLVELHGGNLWLSSEEGKGSKFFFSLPVQPPEGQRGQLS
jgi:signal transduction histidine kinase